MATDNWAGVQFPSTYEGLLEHAKRMMTLNRRLADVSDNLETCLRTILTHHQAGDHDKVNDVLNHLLSCARTAHVIEQAQKSAGISVGFPKVH